MAKTGGGFPSVETSSALAGSIIEAMRAIVDSSKSRERRNSNYYSDQRFSESFHLVYLFKFVGYWLQLVAAVWVYYTPAPI
ncbi:hypothetical protein GJ904_19980 [Salmonella enterica]|nr:hypothetical protein [Salmonella enterica subsp. enterica serovar Saintpaul]EEC1303344.1 hypothetical protein [Salmonella enterica]